MDFFTYQETARKKSGLLLGYFILAVVCIILLLYFVVLLFTGHIEYRPTESPPRPLWNPQLFFSVTGIVLLIIFFGTLYKILELKQGGALIATSLGGQLLTRTSSDLKKKQLLNVVEEMAIASGVPVPPVYFMDKEKGINAFAAGFHPDDAVIGVTQGMLDKLNRDQLQGVIAHEYSHIFNGDMRLNIQLMGLLHGILVIALIGKRILRGAGRGDGKGAAALFMFGLSFMLIGFSGVFFGKLIKSAISRQREFLADASAVQFTRNPGGLSGALKRILSPATGSRIRHPRAEEVSHMYFSNGVKSLGGVFATHPPLRKRILRLDPNWDGTFPALPAPEPPPPPEPGKKAKSALPGIPGVILPGMEAVGDAAFPILITAAAASADQVVNSIGAPTQEQINAAHRLLESIPEELREEAGEALGASTLIYAMILDQSEEVRNLQIAMVESGAGEGVVTEMKRHQAPVKELDPGLLIPLADLCLTGLGTMSPKQYDTFKDLVTRMTEADQELTLLEYTLRHLLFRHLDARINKPRTYVSQIYNIRGVTRECSQILSLLAWFGQDDEAEARKAFEQGSASLKTPKAHFEFLPRNQCELSLVDEALNRLDLVTAKIKKQVVIACLQCLNYDKKITLWEAELFRAVASSMDVPVPPWVVANSLE